MTTRTDLINYLIKKLGLKSYLEIGVQYGYNFNQIECERKIGVEPNHPSSSTLQMTSDEFFAMNNESFDLIFIDGDHSFEQSFKDITNALKCVTHNGLIVCHDVLPKDQDHTNPFLNGEVYKAVAKFNRDYPYRLWTWNKDHGCGVISRRVAEKKAQGEINNYQDFQNNQQVYNIIEDADIIISACLR